MGEAPVAPGDSAPSAAAADKVVAVATPDDLKRLDNLWKERSDQSSIEKDYPIGPGDVLSISVPQVAELQVKKVRVSAQGIIELPLVGIVQAGGVTCSRAISTFTVASASADMVAMSATARE